MILLYIMLALSPTACDADLNGDMLVTATDFLILRGFIGSPCIPIPKPPINVQGDGAMLTWSAPALNTDGSHLLDLIGYKVYCNALVFPVTAPPWQVDLSITQPATCVVTAIDSSGNESATSNPVTF